MESGVAIALISAGAAMGVALINKFVPGRLERKANSATKDLKSFYKRRFDTQSACSELLHKTRAVRVMLIRSENGGGIPQVGKPIYVSVVYEAVSEEVRSVIQRWQARPVDADYELVLRKVLAERSTHLASSDLKEGSVLRDIYESEGIVGSSIFLVAVSPGRAVLFLSLVFTEEVGAMDAHERSLIGSAIDRISKLLDEDDDLLAMPWTPN